MSGVIVEEVLLYADLPDFDRLVLSIIAVHCRYKDRSNSVSMSRLSELTGRSRQHISKSVKRLQDLGLLIVRRKSGVKGSNHYTVTETKCWGKTYRNIDVGGEIMSDEQCNPQRLHSAMSPNRAQCNPKIGSMEPSGVTLSRRRDLKTPDAQNRDESFISVSPVSEGEDCYEEDGVFDDRDNVIWGVSF